MSCFHCGESLPTSAIVEHILDGETRQFCCVGCGFIASAIYTQGLQAYYQHRQLPARKADGQMPQWLTPEVLAQLNLSIARKRTDDVLFDANAASVEVCIFIEDLNCPACSWLIERRLQNLPGVEQVVTTLSARRTRIRYNEQQVTLEQLLTALHHIGYRALPYQPDQLETALDNELNRLLKRLGVAAFCMMQAMMFSFSLYAGLFSDITSTEATWLRWGALLSSLPVLLYSATPFYRNALVAIRARSLNMDVSVSLAILTAFCASAWNTLRASGAVYFDSVAMFAFLLLLGRYIELKVRSKTSLLAATTQRTLPLTVKVWRAESWQTIALLHLQKGERLRVCAGEVIAADGLIVHGQAALDEAVLSGESLPQLRKSGAQVCAGALVRDGAIDIEVNKLGSETYLAQLAQLQDQALSERAPVQLLADRYASYFVAGVLVCTLLSWLFWQHYQPEQAFSVVLAVLVVTCPCALSLALPTAWASATRFLLGRGFLIRRARTLETLARVSSVMLDKTGTLSKGELQVSEFKLLSDIDRKKIACVVGALEQHSSHACAQALRNWAYDCYAESESAADAMGELNITDLHEQAGSGLSARVNGEMFYLGQRTLLPTALQKHADAEAIYLASASELLAEFHLRDELRADAFSFVEALRARGLQVCLASGDAPDAVALCAQQLGITEFSARQSPADKLAQVRALQAQGHCVLMLGDGINDAPVLAGADVSVAVSASTDFARRAADAVLTVPSLHTVIDALCCAQRTQTIVRQNLMWALAYNALALPSAMFGLLSPWEAAAGMSLSSLLVTLNSLRLQTQTKHTIGTTLALNLPPAKVCP